MKRQKVDSSSISSIGYNMGTAVLEVQFMNGKVYQYMNVPATEWFKMMKAESQGQYFYRNIKNKYSGVEVAGETAD